MYIFSVTRLINLSAENELYLINIIVKRQAHAFVLVSTGGCLYEGTFAYNLHSG